MKQLSFLTLLLCIVMGSNGQVNTYSFGYSSGTYTPLSGGTAVVPPYSGISGNGWFEQVYNVPLPFVYFFNGAGYSSVYVNSNGHLAFGSPTTPTNQRPHTLNNGQAGAIIGYGCGVAYQYVGGSGERSLAGCWITPMQTRFIMALLVQRPTGYLWCSGPVVPGQ